MKTDSLAAAVPLPFSKTIHLLLLCAMSRACLFCKDILMSAVIAKVPASAFVSFVEIPTLQAARNLNCITEFQKLSDEIACLHIFIKLCGCSNGL